MKADLPAERWFWFDPPFHRNQSALLHRQADNVWRIDFQLGWDADPDLEKQVQRVGARIRAMLGEHAEFELQWVSVYTFQCRRMEKFRHGRVLFAGDAAHQVSPFGARGGNGGIQDGENLAWKLALVATGQAPDRLLDSYDAERGPAAGVEGHVAAFERRRQRGGGPPPEMPAELPPGASLPPSPNFPGLPPRGFPGLSSMPGLPRGLPGLPGSKKR